MWVENNQNKGGTVLTGTEQQERTRARTSKNKERNKA